MWSCVGCTYRSGSSLFVCEMCGAARPPSSVPPACEVLPGPKPLTPQTFIMSSLFEAVLSKRNDCEGRASFKKLFMPLVTKYISAGGSSLFCGENHTLVSLFLVADNDTDLSTLFEAHRSACAPTREQQHDFEKRVADMLSKPVKALANQEPLIWACRNDRSRCVRELLKAKANVEGSSDANKMSPLHHAANNNKLDCVEMLVKYGANTVALDSEGKTPKFYAQQNTNVRAYLLAVERGCEREKLLSAIFACTRQQPYTFIWPIIEFCVEYVYGEIEIR